MTFRGRRAQSKTELREENNNQSSLIQTGLETCRADSILNLNRASRTLVDPVFDFQFRLILVGDSTVGKTSLLRSLTRERFDPGREATVGVDFMARSLKVQGSKVKLHLWDTAGQERFRFLSRSYYRNSVGVVIAYSLVNRSSFSQVSRWAGEALEFAGNTRPSLIVIGCKLDLVEVGVRREVAMEEGQQLADSLGALFMETSAKQGKGVEEAFQLLCEEILERLEVNRRREEESGVQDWLQIVCI